MILVMVDNDCGEDWFEVIYVLYNKSEELVLIYSDYGWVKCL